MPRKIASIIAAATAAVIGATAFPGTASADPIIGVPPQCTPSNDVSGPDFNVKLCGVSDVDQFRNDLADNGDAYCGPTSLYNVLHYFSHEKGAPIGWGTKRVGDADPLKPADYDVVTDSIWRIGIHASYDGKTNLNDLQTAFNIATIKSRDAGWETEVGNVSTATATDFAGALAGRLNKGPLQMAYGRYKTRTNGSLERSGGHIMTVVAAQGNFNGTTMQLKLADPGRAGDHKQGDYLDTQSAYQLLDVTLTRRAIWEHMPPADDPNTAKDESLEEGDYRIVSRWELTGPQYTGTTRQMVENFNWFTMTKP